MTMINFAVYDDDKKMLEGISDKLREYYPDECNIKTYNNSTGLLLEYRRSCFDALFIDIDLSETNGMEIAEKIREADRRVKIILVSSKSELAYKGYLYNAFRFVRKSNLDQELCEAAKSLKQAFSSPSEYIVFKTSRGEAFRAAEDIKFFEAKTHFINVVCNDEVIRIYGTLREYEGQIGNNGFIRIHKSYLVNFKYIRSVEKNAVILSCGKKLPLSRYRAKETKMKIMFFSRNPVI